MYILFSKDTALFCDDVLEILQLPLKPQLFGQLVIVLRRVLLSPQYAVGSDTSSWSCIHFAPLCVRFCTVVLCEPPVDVLLHVGGSDVYAAEVLYDLLRHGALVEGDAAGRQRLSLKRRLRNPPGTQTGFPAEHVVLLYCVLHVLHPYETPGQLHHPVLVLEVLHSPLVCCKVSDLMSQTLVLVADKRNIPLATHFHQPGVLRTVIGHKHIMSPLALVQSKLQVDVGRTSVCTYHIADRSLQTVVTLPASQHQCKLRRIHERSLEPFIAAHMRILEYRRAGDYPVYAHGLCKPGEQRLRAYEQ